MVIVPMALIFVNVPFVGIDDFSCHLRRLHCMMATKILFGCHKIDDQIFFN
jgi:hypothetical protein